ncbi:MAG: hypothetical protein JXA08_00385 [Methanomicrobiaceae archaeon]|nr:hypothetical protein [Methanomicrobiaceae archaeon]
MNRKYNQKLCLVALTLLVAGALFAAPALALKVEGARIALDVEPGTTTTSPIVISINTEESEGTFAIDVMGFGQSPAEGTYTGLEAAADTSPYSARTFITIDTPTVTLKPGERADVTATITVPSGTLDGGRYAIILVHPAASASGAPAAFATAVAIPVFLTVSSGAITEAGEISALAPAAADPATPFEVAATFTNTGNYHYYGVVSTVTINDTAGTEIASVRNDPFIRAVVPGQSIDFSMAISDGLAEGSYQMIARVEKQDGTLLAEKTGTLRIGNPAAAPSASAAATPGFGALAAMGGLAVVLFGALRYRKGGR